jgi:hypothetical protein
MTGQNETPIYPPIPLLPVWNKAPHARKLDEHVSAIQPSLLDRWFKYHGIGNKRAALFKNEYIYFRVDQVHMGKQALQLWRSLLFKIKPVCDELCRVVLDLKAHGTSGADDIKSSIMTCLTDRTGPLSWSTPYECEPIYFLMNDGSELIAAITGQKPNPIGSDTGVDVTCEADSMVGVIAPLAFVKHALTKEPFGGIILPVKDSPERILFYVYKSFGASKVIKGKFERVEFKVEYFPRGSPPRFVISARNSVSELNRVDTLAEINNSDELYAYKGAVIKALGGLDGFKCSNE